MNVHQFWEKGEFKTQSWHWEIMIFLHKPKSSIVMDEEN